MTDSTADLPEWRRPNPPAATGASIPPTFGGVHPVADPVAAMTWDQHQDWERAWWGDCVNTFGEQAKHLTYADRMGLVNEPRDGQWPVYDLGNRSVMDIGGGPCSILLTCLPPVIGFEGPTRRVIDPCPYPEWINARYDAAGIQLIRMVGEDEQHAVRDGAWDEVWIYNVLQHTQNPEKIVRNACRIGKVVRLFEWIDTPTAPGHPHTLRSTELRLWLNAAVGAGVVEDFAGENGLVGRAFHGVFPQNHAAAATPAAAVSNPREVDALYLRIRQIIESEVEGESDYAGATALNEASVGRATAAIVAAVL